MSLSDMFVAGAAVRPQIHRFLPDDMPRGGGDNDKHDEDNALAAQFKSALRQQWSATGWFSTADPYGLSSMSERIISRVTESYHCYFLIGEDLRAVAQEVIRIPGYSDKRNGYIVADRLKGMAL